MKNAIAFGLERLLRARLAVRHPGSQSDFKTSQAGKFLPSHVRNDQAFAEDQRTDGEQNQRGSETMAEHGAKT